VTLWLLFAGAVGCAVLAMFGWFDSPAEAAASEARKCGTARKINVLADADRYCGKALEILRQETSIPVLVVARVHTESAALAIVRKRIDESVQHCEIAVVAWREVKEQWNIAERERSTQACESVISAAKPLKQRDGGPKATKTQR
jgi:hypothetical protein